MSASYHSALLALLERDEIQGGGSGQAGGGLKFAPTPLVKNGTGEQVPWGGVVELDGLIFDAEQNQSGFLTGSPQFKSKKPGENASAIAIALQPMPDGKARKMGVLGWYPARVDIKEESHRAVKVVENDVTKFESTDGGLPMFPAESGTGEKWALVFLGGTGGGASAPSIATQTIVVFENIPGAQLEITASEIRLTPTRFAGKVLDYDPAFPPGPTNPNGLEGEPGVLTVPNDPAGANGLVVFEYRMTVPVIVGDDGEGWGRIMTVAGPRDEENGTYPYVVNPDCGRVFLQ